VRRILVLAFAIFVAAAAVALAYPPATVTVTPNSVTLGNLECNTRYEVRVREYRSGAFQDSRTYTPTTSACPVPTPTPTPEPTPEPTPTPTPEPTPEPVVPVANFTVTPTPAIWGEPVTFSSTSTCADAPCTYRWFHANGDSTGEIEAGAAQPNTEASHTYTANPYWQGPANVRLQVTDASGDVDDETKTFALENGTTEPPPPSSGYPDASNTGPSGILTPQSGNVTLSVAGQVFENRDVSGCITVNAPSVTIRNVRVRCAGQSAIWSGSTGLVVEDTEVDCLDAAGRTGITPGNYTVRRVEASRCENIFWSSSNVLIEDSYIHTPIPCCTATQPHTDSIQFNENSSSNVTIRHNRIYGGYINQSNFGNAAIQVGFNPTNVTIDDNILAGGGHTLRLLKATNSTNLQVTNNRFSRVFVSTVGGFGPHDGNKQNADVWSGNVYHETNEPL
jgi:hypothetical protein